jgi:hypothetical protein
MYPEPDGFASAAVRPAQAFYHDTLSEFILPYDAVLPPPRVVGIAPLWRPSSAYRESRAR